MGFLAQQLNTSPITVVAGAISGFLALVAVESVDFVKIDIEVFEAAGLHDANALLMSDRRPPVVFEFVDWAESRAGASRNDRQRRLLQLGYRLHVIESGSRLVPMSEPMIEGGGNILAIPGLN